MSARLFLSLVAGLLFMASFVPFIVAMVRRKTQPTRASWIIWFLVDFITFGGMWVAGTINSQIVAAVIGTSIIVILSRTYGKSGWSTLDSVCLACALITLGVWQRTGDPSLAILLSAGTNTIGAIPTIASAWENPLREPKVGWAMGTAACVLTVFLIPAWTVADAAQPLTFLVVNTGILSILLFRRAPVPHL